MITVFDDMQRSHAPREFIVSGKPQPIPETPGAHRHADGGRAPASAARSWRRPRSSATPSRWCMTGATSSSSPPCGSAGSGCPMRRKRPRPMSSRWAAPTFRPRHYPDSVVGQCGWHLGDGSCPVTAKTWAAARASAATAAHGAKLVLAGRAHRLCAVPPARPPRRRRHGGGLLLLQQHGPRRGPPHAGGQAHRHPRHRRPPRQWHGGDLL